MKGSAFKKIGEIRVNHKEREDREYREFCEENGLLFDLGYYVDRLLSTFVDYFKKNPKSGETQKYVFFMEDNSLEWKKDFKERYYKEKQDILLMELNKREPLISVSFENNLVCLTITGYEKHIEMMKK